MLLYNRFHLLIQHYLDNQMDIEQLKVMRQDVVADIMSVVVSFVDQLRIYEYVFNRVEYQFRDKEEYPFDKEYYNTYFINDLIHYIFSEKR